MEGQSLSPSMTGTARWLSAGQRLPSTSTISGVVGQRRDRDLHGDKRRLQNIDPVDLLDAYDADTDQPGGADRQIQLLSSFGAEQLGIIEALGRLAIGEYHGGGDHRPGPGAASGFVHTGDEPRLRPRERPLRSDRRRFRRLALLFHRPKTARREQDRKGNSHDLNRSNCAFPGPGGSNRSVLSGSRLRFSPCRAVAMAKRRAISSA